MEKQPEAEQALPYAEALLASGAVLTVLEVVEDSKPIPGMWGQWLVSVEDVRRMGERRNSKDEERVAKPAARHDCWV